MEAAVSVRVPLQLQLAPKALAAGQRCAAMVGLTGVGQRGMHGPCWQLWGGEAGRASALPVVIDSSCGCSQQVTT